MPMKARRALRERARAERTTLQGGGFQPAWICFGSSPTPIPWMMLDYPARGARLTAAHANILSDLFTLILSKDGKSRRLCRVAWPKKPHLGIRFVPQSEAAKL